MRNNKKSREISFQFQDNQDLDIGKTGKMLIDVPKQRRGFERFSQYFAPSQHFSQSTDLKRRKDSLLKNLFDDIPNLGQSYQFEQLNNTLTEEKIKKQRQRKQVQVRQIKCAEKKDFRFRKSLIGRHMQQISEIGTNQIDKTNLQCEKDILQKLKGDINIDDITAQFNASFTENKPDIIQLKNFKQKKYNPQQLNSQCKRLNKMLNEQMLALQKENVQNNQKGQSKQEHEEQLKKGKQIYKGRKYNHTHQQSSSDIIKKKHTQKHIDKQKNISKNKSKDKPKKHKSQITSQQKHKLTKREKSKQQTIINNNKIKQEGQLKKNESQSNKQIQTNRHPKDISIKRNGDQSNRNKQNETNRPTKDISIKRNQSQAQSKRNVHQVKPKKQLKRKKSKLKPNLQNKTNADKSPCIKQSQPFKQIQKNESIQFIRSDHINELVQLNEGNQQPIQNNIEEIFQYKPIVQEKIPERYVYNNGGMMIQKQSFQKEKPKNKRGRKKKQKSRRQLRKQQHQKQNKVLNDQIESICISKQSSSLGKRSRDYSIGYKQSGVIVRGKDKVKKRSNNYEQRFMASMFPDDSNKIKFVQLQTHADQDSQSTRYPKRNRIAPLLYWCQKKQYQNGQFIGISTRDTARWKSDRYSYKRKKELYQKLGIEENYLFEVKEKQGMVEIVIKVQSGQKLVSYGVEMDVQVVKIQDVQEIELFIQKGKAMMSKFRKYLLCQSQYFYIKNHSTWPCSILFRFQE